MLPRSRRLFLIATSLILLALSAAHANNLRASATTPVLINEFMPNPASGAEWAELFNPNPFPIDVSGWKLDDDSTTNGASTLIGAGSVIPSNGLLLVSLTATILNNSG